MATEAGTGHPAGRTTTRRAVVRTGLKLAYAAPVVAGTVRLSARPALAAVSGGTLERTMVDSAGTPELVYTCGQPVIFCNTAERAVGLIEVGSGWLVCAHEVPDLSWCGGDDFRGCSTSEDCEFGEFCAATSCCTAPGSPYAGFSLGVCVRATDERIESYAAEVVPVAGFTPPPDAVQPVEAAEAAPASAGIESVVPYEEAPVEPAPPVEEAPPVEQPPPVEEAPPAEAPVPEEAPAEGGAEEPAGEETGG